MQPAKSPEPKTHDITENFTRACNGLDVGQLVKDEYFTLFESIGALEIMDPKMDSGFLLPGETLEDAYDTLAPLLPEEVIGIMDQLLCHEMAWHTGYPLSQTLFTSVYIDQLLWPEPKTFEQAQFYRGTPPTGKRPGILLEVLRAYCLALVKCCDFVIAKIIGRDYFEEEDFCTHTYNRALFVQVPLDVFTRELDDAVDQLEDEADISVSLRAAIVTRLKFRRDFLTALDPDCSVSNLKSYWSPLVASLPTINTSNQLGTAVAGSFSTKIQRRLASTVPPRPIVELHFKDAFDKLKQLCTDCEHATEFKDLPLDPQEYQAFLWAYASRDPAPLPYSRSFLATILFHTITLHTSTSLPLLDVKILVFPSSPVLDSSNWAISPPRNPLLPKPPRLQFALYIDEFVERAGQPYLDFWTTLGQNRCRLRRMMTHVITGWDQLQSDAGLVDEDIARVGREMGIQDQLMKFPLTTWVYHKKLWMVEKVILLGFEQDIYLADEYAGMYYFLSCIAFRRVEILENISKHFEDRIQQLEKTRDITAIAEVEEGLLYIASSRHEAVGIAQFSTALYRFYIALLYLGLMNVPARPFSTEQLRYELRMKPFLTLQPPEVLPYANHREQLQPFGPYSESSAPLLRNVGQAGSTFWEDIDGCLKNAKEAFSNLKKGTARAARAEGSEKAWAMEVQSSLASCVALGVAIVGLKNGIDTNKDISSTRANVTVDIPGITTGKRYAEGWVVPRIAKT